MSELRRHLNGRAGPEGLLYALAERIADPRAVRAAALLVHQLDVAARERIIIHDKEQSHART